MTSTAFGEWIYAKNLQVGKTYKISKRTPILKDKPSTILEKIAGMKKIKAGSLIKVIKIIVKKEIPWYYVRVKDPEKKKTKTGWINSVFLLGQRLEEVD